MVFIKLTQHPSEPFYVNVKAIDFFRPARFPDEDNGNTDIGVCGEPYCVVETVTDIMRLLDRVNGVVA